MQSVRDMIRRGKLEIKGDIDAGIVPATVDSFSQLHDYVDANEYAGLCDDNFMNPASQEGADIANEVQWQIDEWLRTGATECE